jgi:hypothetical protein
VIATSHEVHGFLGTDTDDPLVSLVHAPIERAINQHVGWEVEQASYTKYYPKTERGGDSSYFPGGFGGIAKAGGTSRILMLDHKYVIPTGLQVWEYSGANFGESASFGADSLLTSGEHYVLDLDDANVSKTGHLKRLGADWPKSRGSVKVTYTAGFTAAELAGRSGNTNASDIKYAVLLAILKAYNQVQAQRKKTATGTAGVITGETIDGYSYRLDPGATQLLTAMTNTLPLEVQQRLSPYRRFGMVI